jgi:hypothetical protein
MVSSRRGIVPAAAAVFAVAGAGLIATAVHSQRHPPAPAQSAAGSVPLADPRSPGPGTHHPAGAPTVLPASRPLALDIPAIRVHSPLQYLGLTAAGALQVPAPGPRYDQAAWYRYSPTPGSLGPAIIEGHVDSAAAGPSVFFDLGRLRPHDEVRVTRADGRVAVFAVDGVRRYPKDRFPTQLVYGDLDHAGLRLLTCGGRFDRTTGHYVDNVVVFASLVGSGASE